MPACQQFGGDESGAEGHQNIGQDIVAQAALDSRGHVLALGREVIDGIGGAESGGGGSRSADRACWHCKAARARWKIYEVPISYSGRTYDEGKKIGWRDALSAIVAIIYYRFLD